MATNYLSEAKLTRLAQRIENVYLKQSTFNTTIADYSTTTQMNSAIASAIAGVTQFDYEIVQALPQEGVKGKIYLVPNTGSGTNIYDEYLWIVSGDPAVGRFELFGEQMIELVEYTGSATITVTDGTGADAGKKVVSIKFNNSDFVADSTNGLQLSAAVKASLGLADTAIQGLTSNDNSVVVTGNGTTKDLAVSQTIQNGAAAGATAVQSITSTGATIVPTGDGTTKNVEVAATIVAGAAAGATALQPSDIGEIPDATIDALWTS